MKHLLHFRSSLLFAGMGMTAMVLMLASFHPEALSRPSPASPQSCGSPPCPLDCQPAMDTNDTTTPQDWCTYPNTGCPGNLQPSAFSGCCAGAPSPILIDTTGNGFVLTDAKDGVRFDISGTGRAIQIAWTASNSENGFLGLPGTDGLIHNGKQLFGNFTLQPPSTHPNGFLALAVYDQPANGGNGDGIIDSRDKIFSSLRLWIDANHDGICQPEELHTLPSMGVDSISLNYHASMRRDQFGNLFRYRAKVNPLDRNDASEVGRTAYDVFLSTAK